MPTRNDLLTLIRKGCSPEDVVRRMGLRPSHLRRMLAGKRFRKALTLEEDLAAVMAVHEIATGVKGAMRRFTELLESESPETARKVATAILHEAFNRGAAERKVRSKIDAPAALLRIVNADRDRPDGEED